MRKTESGRVMTHPKQHTTFQRFKLLKFWIQSFLGGVGKIVCGFRDDDGQVQENSSYELVYEPRQEEVRLFEIDPDATKRH
eukprot:766523-Hanusia_phi.AAC.6